MQLILNTFGASLRRKDGMFHVLSGEKDVVVSPQKVESICLATAVHLSTDAIRLALEHHIDIVLVDSRGDPYGRFWHGRPGSTTALRRRQIEIAGTLEGVLLAREWVQTKLANQAKLLRDLGRTRIDRRPELEAAAEAIERHANSAETVSGHSLDEVRGALMGTEGVAGRQYFAALSLALPQRFRFSGRSRSPAVDPFNCLLNYAYGVLYGLVERACLLTGLDPYAGLLHVDNYNKLSLVFDLVERFRVHAERVCVTLCAGRQVHDGLFDQVEGGYRLNADGRTLLLSTLNDHLDDRIRHGRRNLRRRDTIVYECQRLVGRLLRGLGDEMEPDLSVFDIDAAVSSVPADADVRDSHEEKPC